jgi:hypothetical protein
MIESPLGRGKECTSSKTDGALGWLSSLDAFTAGSSSSPVKLKNSKEKARSR